MRAHTTIAAMLALGPWCSAQTPSVGAPSDGELDALEALYREFHRTPELSFHERATSERVARELEAAGLAVTRNVGGFGVVGVLRNGDGPTVLVRTDLDALPIVEETGLDYASTVRVVGEGGVEVGVMHACGHDIHMTSLVGTARALARARDAWRGTLVMIGQPAEERSGGAKAMLADGLFTRFPKPDYALAMHVAHDLPTGTVGWRAGFAMANVDSVDVTLFGRGGHGAAPHLTIDPVVQGAELVLALQTIVSREIAATDPAVITVGSIHAGSKHNIVPDRCHLQITVRSYRDEVREHLLEGIRRKARAVALAARAPEPEIALSEGTPAAYNDPELVARVVVAFERAFGADRVVPVDAVMTAEDFALYGRAGVSSFMFRLGTVAAERLARYAADGVAPPPLHSARYRPDARASLSTGVAAMTLAVCELLSR